MENQPEIYEYELIDICFQSEYELQEEDTVGLVCEDEPINDADTTQIEYDADGIPMGRTAEEIKMRKQIIFQFYEKWKNDHPDKAVFNKDLKADILIRKESVVEASGHAPKRYRSTLAVLRLEELLANAIKVDEDAPKKGDKNQAKLKKMLLMSYQCPEIGTIKLTVGVRRRSQDMIQYGITALEDGETITPANKKNKASHKK